MDIIVLDRPINHLDKSLSHIQMTFDLMFSCLCLLTRNHGISGIFVMKAGFLYTVIRFFTAGEGLVSNE